MNYKIHTNIPQTHTDIVRLAMWDAWAWIIGNYSYCAFVIPWVGYFKPMDGAKPVIGSLWQMESVIEDRLEYVCDQDHLHAVVEALKDSHPYEEPPIEIYKLEDPKTFYL